MVILEFWCQIHGSRTSSRKWSSGAWRLMWEFGLMFINSVWNFNLESNFCFFFSWQFMSMRREGDNGRLSLRDLSSKMSRLKVVGENLSEEERASFLRDSYQNLDEDLDFELFLRVRHGCLVAEKVWKKRKGLWFTVFSKLGSWQVYLKLLAHASSRVGSAAKNSSAFLKAATTTLLHTISESEKASYVAHINNYLGEDKFLKQYLPMDASTNDLFEIAKDGVLLWWYSLLFSLLWRLLVWVFCLIKRVFIRWCSKLINVAVPGTIDERAINTKRVLNPWERNENHTLCLNSAKAIGCTVVNIGTQDFIEGRVYLHAFPYMNALFGSWIFDILNDVLMGFIG